MSILLRSSPGCSSSSRSSLLARSSSQIYRPPSLPFPLSYTRSIPLCPSSTTNPLLFHVRATRRVFVSLSRNTLLNKPIAPTLIQSSRPQISPTMAVTTTTQTQTRAHAGHSHHHHHDNTYLTSTNKADAGVRITRIGLFVNLGMAIGKGLGGYYFHSQGTFGIGNTADIKRVHQRHRLTIRSPVCRCCAQPHRLGERFHDTGDCCLGS